MKKLTFTILLTIFVFATIVAQPSLQWATTLNGPIATDKGKDITTDQTGNIYVTGSSDGLGTGTDYLTIKYNPNGSILWTKSYNGSANGADVPEAIKLDNSGNVYVTGKSQGNGTGYDFVTIKYNSSGVQQWTAVYNGGANQDDFVYELAVDETGNVYVVGSSFYSAGNMYFDGVIIKYNSSGAQQWKKQLDAINNDVANLVKINNSGNIIVSVYAYRSNTTGFFNPAEDGFKIYELSPSNGVTIFQYSGSDGTYSGYPNSMVLDGSDDIYMISSYRENSKNLYTFKFTHFQNLDWYYLINNPDATVNGIDIKIDPNHNVYVLADYVGSNHDYLMLKFNANGQNLLFKIYNSPANLDDTPVSLYLNTNTNPDIFVTGYTATANGTHNITTIKYSNNGNQLWAIDYDCGNNGDDVASAMVLDNYSNIYITGYSDCDGTNEDVKTIKYCNSAPPATITPNGATICQSGNVTLTANACTGCTYLWSSGQTSQSITVSPATTTTYTVGVTNTIGCSATSLPATVTVNQPSVPSVNVSASSTSICPGQNVTFIATATNGGASPIYQWYVNGILVGGNTPTYSTMTLTDGAQVNCTMTSNAACINPTMATSNVLVITVNPPVVPGVSVTTPFTSICSGQNVTFTAIPTSGGTSPVYQWYVNNSPVGSNSQMYITTTLTNGSQVYCTMTSNAVCANPVMATSNSLIITVNPSVVPGVNITTPFTSICLGQNITFTATPTHEGTTPIYQWYANGAPVGGNSPTYSITTLTNGALVYCAMSSNAVCANPTTATSNALAITVNPTLVASVNINATPTSICSGQTVTFAAAPINGGTSPSYQWYVNGIPVGDNSQTYPTTTLTNGAQVYCTMTSNAACANPVMANSNSLAITVNPALVPSVTVTASPTSICPGQNVTFTAAPTNGGVSPSYQWYLNGISVGTNSPIYSSMSLDNGAQVYCTMSSNASCINPTTVSSAPINIVATSLPQPNLLISNDTIYASNFTSGQYSFNWHLNGNFISTEYYVICQTLVSGLYELTINFNGCTASNSINIASCIVGTNDNEKVSHIVVSPNPTNDFFTIEGYELKSGHYNIRLSNVFGQVLIEKSLWLSNPSFSTQLNVESFPSGNYYIAIYSEMNKYVFSVQKLK